MDDEGDLRAASDPQTPPDALGALARRGGAYAAAVASNPNTPVNLLLWLLKDHPDQVLTNPTWDLALLVNPTLVLRTGFMSHRAMAASPALTPLVAEALVEANDYVAMRILVSNPACPPLILERFAVGLAADLRAQAASNPGTPPRLLELLRKAGAAEGKSPPDLAFSTITGDELVELSRALPWGRQVAIRHPHSPPALLAALARSGLMPSQLVHLLSNPACPRELLTELAVHESIQVRCEIARKLHITPEALRLLLETSDQEPWPLTVALLENPTLSTEMIERLARDRLRIPWVARRVAAHPSAPLHVLIAIHDQGEVPEGLAVAFARNPAFPAERLAQIDAAQSPHDRHFRALLAGRDDTDPGLLVQITGCNYQHARQKALANPRLPEAWRALLERVGFPPGLGQLGSLTAPLTHDEMIAMSEVGPWLRYYLLQRSDLPAALLESMARRHGREVGARLRAREGVPESALALLPRRVARKRGKRDK